MHHANGCRFVTPSRWRRHVELYPREGVLDGRLRMVFILWGLINPFRTNKPQVLSDPFPSVKTYLINFSLSPNYFLHQHYYRKWMVKPDQYLCWLLDQFKMKVVLRSKENKNKLIWNQLRFLWNQKLVTF